MSKSKGSGKTIDTPQARPGKRERLRALLWNRAGCVRTGWLLILAIGCHLLTNLVLRAGLTAGFATLFRTWGIDAANAHRAPAWARILYTWHGSAVTAVTALALIVLALLLRRRFPLAEKANPAVRSGLFPAVVGILAAVLSGALFLLTDSFRLDWPLAEPRITAGLPALLMIHLLSILAAELLGRGVIYALFRQRWGTRWATLASSLLFTLATGLGSGPIGMLNAMLLGALCCRLFDRRGLWAGVGLRLGWSAANLFLLGFGGGESAVYRLYAVSEIPLTGGDAGLSCGLWVTCLLCLALAWHFRDCVPSRLLRGRRCSA